MNKNMWGGILKKIVKKWPKSEHFFLEMNDRINMQLRKKLSKSLWYRSLLYGEGAKRLSNDPDITVFNRWFENGNSLWAEVVSFNIKAFLMFNESKVLELCCANGWYYREFYYSLPSINHYIGCDISEEIIEEATVKTRTRLKNKGKGNNVEFVVADIFNNMPLEGESLTHILWYAAMCMFKLEERGIIFEEISKRLKEKNGILCGSGVLKNPAKSQWKYYVGLIDSEEDLRSELCKYFKNVYISRCSEGDILLFMASDGNLPCYNK